MSLVNMTSVYATYRWQHADLHPTHTYVVSMSVTRATCSNPYSYANYTSTTATCSPPFTAGDDSYPPDLSSGYKQGVDQTGPYVTFEANVPAFIGDPSDPFYGTTKYNVYSKLFTNVGNNLWIGQFPSFVVKRISNDTTVWSSTTATYNPVTQTFVSAKFRGNPDDLFNYNATVSLGRTFWDGASSGNSYTYTASSGLWFNAAKSPPPFVLGPGGADIFGGNTNVGSASDPVNTATGNFYSIHNDISIPGKGLPLGLTRTYNAEDTANRGGFGYGWAHSYEAAILFDSNSNATVRLGDGKQLAFTYNSANGSYAAPTGTFERLERNQNGTYSYIFKDQSRLDFNSNGRLMNTADRRGNGATLTYANGLLTNVTDTSGRSLAFTYTSGKITQVTDSLGRNTVYGYNAAGDLTSVMDPRGGVAQYAYSNHLLISATDPENQTFLTNTYDASSRVTEQSDGAAGVFYFTYDTLFHITTITDPEAHETVHLHDTSNRLTSETDGLGGVTSYTYDANGVRSSVTDKNGHTTTIVNDSNGNPISVTDPLDNETLMTYNGANDLLTMEDQLGHMTTYARDAYGNATSVTDPLNHVTMMTYNGFGKPLTVTDALSNTTTFTYDAYGNQVTATDALNNQTATAYDLAGRKTQVTDASANITHYTYDGNDNLVTVVDAADNTTTYTYDANDLLTSISDPNGHVTTNTYDAMDNLVTVTDPEDNVTNYTYDGNFNKTSVTDANDQTTEYSYDAANRLTTVTYPDSSTVTYGYDNQGNRTTMTNAGGTTTYTYDDVNRVLSQTNPADQTISRTYDATGRQVSMTSPAGVTAYVHNSAGKLTLLVDPMNQTTAYEYNDIGQRTKTTLGNGVTADVTYNAAYQLTSLINKKSANDVLSSFAYEYNASGLKTKMTEADGSYTDYEYDELKRLTNEVKNDINDTLLYSLTYTYDPSGNRLSKTDQNNVTTAYTYDDADRVLTAGDATFVFDANGNMTGKTIGQDTTVYSYDYENRMTSAALPSETTAFAYAGDGMRRSKVVDTETTNYLTDGLNTIRETNGNSTTIADYTTDPSRLVGQIISRTDAAEDTSFYSGDGIGSTRNLTDPMETQTAAYSYDSFGNVINHTGTDATYTFSTKEQDGTGLYYFAARYYDPTLGRFATQDPAPANLYDPQSLNRYTYCANDPINFVDPWGLMKSPNWVNGTFDAVGTVADGIGVVYPPALVVGAVTNVAGSGYTTYQAIGGDATRTDVGVSWVTTIAGIFSGRAGIIFDIAQDAYDISRQYWKPGW
jgi:RHS repeat-associated protein